MHFYSQFISFILLVKSRYEEEISRLRQQLDQTRSGHTQMTSSSHGSQHTQPPPPNIGPQSNLFGGIMNAGGSGASASQPGLVAPPQMGDQPPPPHGGHYSQPQGPGRSSKSWHLAYITPP
jgi:glucose repression regulatory protein TUP1